MKKLNVLGIELNNYGIFEAVETIGRFLNEDGAYTVRLVTMEQLVLASGDEQVRMALETADIAVIEDRAILEEAGEYSPMRYTELRTRDFFTELIRRIHRVNRSIYLVGPDEESVTAFRQFLEENYKHISIAGVGTISENDSENEKTINDMNMVLPEVVLSISESPQQDYFYESYRSQIYAKVWIGLGGNKPGRTSEGVIARFFREQVLSRLFRLHAGRIESEQTVKETEEEER